jgi:drug/metabolite transporter (DMT)-like permease
MILGATLLWSLEVVVAKRLLAGVSSWTVGVARMGLGSVALLGWLAVRGQLGALVSLTGAEVGWALATGALVAGYVATWFAALARAQAVDVTAVLVLAAPVTALLSAAVNGTTLAPQTPWLAMVVLGGVTMAWLGWRAGPLGGAPVRVETPR